MSRTSLLISILMTIIGLNLSTSAYADENAKVIKEEKTEKTENAAPEVPTKVIETKLHEVYKNHISLEGYTYLNNQISKVGKYQYKVTLAIKSSENIVFKVEKPVDISYRICTSESGAAYQWWIQTGKFSKEDDNLYANNSLLREQRLRLIADLKGIEYTELSVKTPDEFARLDCGELISIVPKAAAEPQPQVDSYDGESEQNREGKMLYAALEAGFAITPLPTGGLTLGYFIARNHLLELTYVLGSFTLGDTKMGWDLMAANYKYFIGNSFYVSSGVGYRKFNFESAIGGISGTTQKLDVKLTAKSLGVEFGLGNQWQWSNFTLGTTWIGAFVPVKTDASSRFVVNGVEPSDAKSLNDNLQQFGKSTHLELLRFYLGVAF